MEMYKCTEVNLPCSSCRPSGSSKALKLGVKGKEVDNFVDKLKSEGENIVTSSAGRKASEASKVLQPPVNIERYHTLTEFISVFDTFYSLYCYAHYRSKVCSLADN